MNNSDTPKARNSHEQKSHSNKRHFHRSKIYRKEGRTKQHGNATKRTTNLFPSGTLLGITSQEISGNLTSLNKDSAKLKISELTARNTRPGSSIINSDDFILLANLSGVYLYENPSIYSNLNHRLNIFFFNTDQDRRRMIEATHRPPIRDPCSRINLSIFTLDLLQLRTKSLQKLSQRIQRLFRNY